jgi:hypothetical protein
VPVRPPGFLLLTADFLTAYSLPSAACWQGRRLRAGNFRLCQRDFSET